MSRSLTLVGYSADFQKQQGGDKPDWEHLALMRRLDCRVVALDDLPAGRLSRFVRNRYLDFGQLYRLGQALRRSPTILAQSEQSGYQAALALAASFSGSRLFIIFHGQRWWTRRNRFLGKLAGRMARVRFLCLSESLRSILIEEYGIAADRVHVTGFGVDARFFQPQAADAAPCIVSAGTASRDYQTLVAASDGLAADVRIAADSNWYKEALNVSEAQVPGNVHIFSSGSYAELRKLYAAARFVVVPLLDVRYACGYAVIAEAMAMGKAVIATRTQAPSDLIADGLTGMYVPPGDAAALRRAIDSLLADEARSRRMGEAARASVERDFSIDRYVARLISAMDLPEMPFASTGDRLSGGGSAHEDDPR